MASSTNLRGAHRPRHHELHRVDRSGWIRATVLGANDGLLSTGALVLGVVGADGSRTAVLTAGVAGVVAGAASMAIGEYVSVRSQRDLEEADRATEEAELLEDPEGEHAELRLIYERRGLERELADQVATALMAHDALGAHLRDELGVTDELRARPVQAAIGSFLSFAFGAALPLLAAAITSDSVRGVAIALATMVGLVALGALGAAAGGARVWRGALRVGLGGLAALALTYGVGSLVGTAL